MDPKTQKLIDRAIAADRLRRRAVREKRGDTHLQTRVDVPAKKSVLRAAKKAKLTPSSWLRQLVEAELQRLGLPWSDGMPSTASASKGTTTGSQPPSASC